MTKGCHCHLEYRFMLKRRQLFGGVFGRIPYLFLTCELCAAFLEAECSFVALGGMIAIQANSSLDTVTWTYSCRCCASCMRELPALAYAQRGISKILDNMERGELTVHACPPSVFAPIFPSSSATSTAAEGVVGVEEAEKEMGVLHVGQVRV